MLLVIRAESAVIGAAIVNIGPVGQRNGAGFVVFAECRVGFRIGVNECLERPALRTALAHVNLVVTQNYLCIDDLATVRADAACEFVKDVVGVFLDSGRAVPVRSCVNLLWIPHADDSSQLPHSTCWNYRSFIPSS